MLFFISSIQIIISIIHYFIYRIIISAYGFDDVYAKYIGIFFLIISFAFLVGNLLIQYFPSKTSNTFYYLSSIWTGFILYLLFASILIGIVALLINYYGLDISITTVANVLFSLAIIINMYGLYNSANIRVVNITIPIKNLPTYWQGKRAAVVSDTHYGPVHNENDAKKTVNMINSIDPDYLFHVGDFYDGPHMDWKLPADEYRAINSRTVKYFVSGNHEEYAERDGGGDVLDAIRGAGFIVTDGKVTMDHGMQIVGTRYDHNENQEVLKQTFSTENHYSSSSPSIVLKHAPLSLDLISSLGGDVLFAGHTHKGQMWPLGYITSSMYNGFDWGLKYAGDLAVYTSSGVGTWGPPQRIGTQSEIVVITFVKG